MLSSPFAIAPVISAYSVYRGSAPNASAMAANIDAMTSMWSSYLLIMSSV